MRILQTLSRQPYETKSLYAGFEVTTEVVFFFGFVRWGETESTWYIGHCLAYCTSPG
jgi:hypothetical protein